MHAPDAARLEQTPAREWPPAEVAAARRRLVALLCEAAELEHGLCLQYLYAAFSLRAHPREAGVDELQAERARQWKGVILGIAREEMLHLALVSNLLAAAGAEPHLRRPNFPQPARFYPLGVDSALEPFCEGALERFLVFEAPAGSQHGPPAAPGGGEPEGDDPGERLTVGQLYGRIREIFCQVPEELLFVGAARRQVDAAAVLDPDRLFPDDVLVGYGVEPFAVTGRATALRAIDLIVEQGEGGEDCTEHCHYARLLAVSRELAAERAAARQAGTAFAPARPVVANPTVRRQPDAPGARRLTHPVALRGAELFNAAYGLMMLMLVRFFRDAGDNREELRELQRIVFFPLMTMVVRPLGEMLTEIPAFRDEAEPTAGATFEFPRDLQALPDREAAWRIFHERLAELARDGEALRRDLAGAAPHLAERAAFLAENLDRLAASVPPGGLP